MQEFEVDEDQAYWDARARLAQMMGGGTWNELSETTQAMFDRAVQGGQDPYEALQDIHAAAATAISQQYGGKIKVN